MTSATLITLLVAVLVIGPAWDRMWRRADATRARREACAHEWDDPAGTPIPALPRFRTRRCVACGYQQQQDPSGRWPS